MSIVSFACKNIKKEELVRCSFGLNKTEYNVLMFLLKRKPPLQTKEISNKMRFERTTIQKAIKGLLEKELVTRRQSNLPNGGYLYRYSVPDRDKIKKQAQLAVEKWYKNVKKEIESW